MNILFVCLGNICRSPLAEGVMRHKAKEAGLDITIDSAGTAAYHIGESPDPRSQESAEKHGMSIAQLKGRQFTTHDFDRFDRIFVMDHENKSNALKLARNSTDEAKVDLLLNLSYPGENMEVPDPYFGGEAGFENVFQLINNACDELIKELTS